MKFEPISKADHNMLYAYEKGYRVEGNHVIGLTGRPLKLSISGKVYSPRFSCRAPSPNPKRETYKIEAKSLSAFQKFGTLIFDPTRVIRYLDGNIWNIREDNFELMTFHESEMHKSEETRKRCAVNAASHLKQYDNDEVKAFYEQCKSYKKTMKKFGISSKGTLHYILFKRQSTKDRKLIQK